MRHRLILEALYDQSLDTVRQRQSVSIQTIENRFEAVKGVVRGTLFS